jgi:hypothetical protein
VAAIMDCVPLSPVLDERTFLLELGHGDAARAGREPHMRSDFIRSTFAASRERPVASRPVPIAIRKHASASGRKPLRSRNFKEAVTP